MVVRSGSAAVAMVMVDKRCVCVCVCVFMCAYITLVDPMCTKTKCDCE